MLYSVLGICAGNGTVLFPFKDQLIGNFELRSVFKFPKNEQWELNFKGIPLWNKKGAGFDMLDTIKKPDIIIGHPDCGHSSVLSYSRAKKLGVPADNVSLQAFFTGVQWIKPKVFLMENLPALLKTYGKENLEETFSDYHLKFFIGPVTKWGNSQKSRKRLVIIGVNKAYPEAFLDNFKLSKHKIHKLKYYNMLVKQLDCLNDAQKEAVAHVRLSNNTKIAIFGGKKMTLKEIKDVWNSLPPTQKRFPANKERMKYAPGVYRNLNNDYPLTVRKGNREFTPKGNVLTPRQRARIQGVPDSFNIFVNMDKLGYSITKGNITVTKCFPYEISLWFKKCLDKSFHQLNS